MNYLTRPVFEFAHDWTNRPPASWKFDARELTLGFGASVVSPLQEEIVHGWTLHLSLREEEIAAFETFTDALTGRLQGFWLPSPDEACAVVASTDASHFIITDQGWRDTFDAHPAQHLYFEKAGETAQCAKILDVSDNGDGTEEVELTTELSTPITPDWTVRRLHYVRLADDEIKAEHRAEQWLEAEVKCVELPTEYSEYELGERLVYLYHFWLDVAGTLFHYRYTSFAASITSGGNPFTAAPINHSAVTRSASDAQGVTIEADYNAAAPLSSLLLGRLMRPLWVEVHSAPYETPNTTTLEFSGRVGMVTVQERKLSIKCHTWMDALDVDVPSFWLQRRCNYRLFEPTTCALLRSAWEQSCTVTAIDGQVLTITGAGLAGLAADWFMQGWIELGSGITREELLIVTSTMAVGETLTVTVTTTPRFATAPCAAVVLPGCDGRSVTCLVSFDNFARFGGHRLPAVNPVLRAMTTDTTTGTSKK